MDPAATRRVLLAIPTRARPRLLAQCLETVAAVRVPPGVTFEVLVVDNNPDADARAVVEAWARELPGPIVHVHEPSLGIVMVRNRAIEEAIARGADALAFVDDDSLVDSAWLEESLRALEDQACDVVIGPIELAFPPGTPPWLTEDFPLVDRPSSSVAPADFDRVVSSSNVLLRIHLVREWGLRFPEAFNLSGGEDTAFFQQARERGAVTGWAGGARVTEVVPPSRATLRWSLQRWFRIGNASAHLEDHLGTRHLGWFVTLHNLGHVLEKGLLHPLLAVVTLDLSARRWAGMAGNLARHLGGFLACLGYRYLEYSEVHGA
jgi:succinoglycan biosynthesis protein ExoM